MPDGDGRSRRSILRTFAYGVATAGIAGTAHAHPGLGVDASKDGPPGGGPPEDVPQGPPDDRGLTGLCPEGQVLLAKYEVTDDGEFTFDRGRDSLNIDSDAVSFSNVVAKDSESNEIVGFDWDSNPYDVCTVSVKYGLHSETFTPDEEVVEAGTTNDKDRSITVRTNGSVDVRKSFDGDGPVPAISNVVFCKKVYWQVDFGHGTYEGAPGYDREVDRNTNGFEDNKDLIMAAIGGTPYENGFELNPATGPKNKRGVIVGFTDCYNEFCGGRKSVDVAFDVSPAYEDIVGDDHATLHLLSFELPGPYRRGDVDSQVLFDKKQDSIEVDTNGRFWSVDLPGLD